MKIVGDHLADQAVRRSDAHEADLFGRSAFNRYYYSAFLSVRTTLKKIEPNWATPTHQGIPEVLKGQVLVRLKKTINTATKMGRISEIAGKQSYRAANKAAVELANLLTAARETRRLADYEPETPITRDADSIKLGQFTLRAASSWKARVEAQSGTILHIYEQYGLI